MSKFYHESPFFLIIIYILISKSPIFRHFSLSFHLSTNRYYIAVLNGRMVDMFTDTSKNAYFLDFFLIFEILEKKKGLPSNFQGRKSFIFVPFKSLFDYFRQSNVIVSTCVGDIRGTCQPLQGRL